MAAMAGPPGPACHLGISRACSLRCEVAVGICATTASCERPHRVHAAKEIVTVARVLVHGRARGLRPHLSLLGSLPRAYHPRHPPPPALSISNSPWAKPESPEKGFVTGRHQMTSLCDAMVRRPEAFGFPVWRCTPGVALLVHEGTSPGRGPAAVGADWPCTPPRARAFGGTVPSPDTYS